MSAIFNFLKGGVACVFGACLVTGVLMFAGLILLVIVYPIVLKIPKSKKEASSDSKPEYKENFFFRHLYKIFAVILFADAIIICFLLFRDRGVVEILFVSVVAYIASFFGGFVFYAASLALVSLAEKFLRQYIELKRSIIQDYEKSYVPICISTFFGFCIFACFLPK